MKRLAPGGPSAGRALLSAGVPQPAPSPPIALRPSAIGCEPKFTWRDEERLGEWE